MKQQIIMHLLIKLVNSHVNAMIQLSALLEGPT